MHLAVVVAKNGEGGCQTGAAAKGFAKRSNRPEAAGQPKKAVVAEGHSGLSCL